jgi:hypothetical protein
MKYLAFLKQPKALYGLVLALGIGLGLIWGWVIQPVEWTDADPTTLAANYQEEYLRMTIDSFRVNANEDVAKSRFTTLGGNGLPLMLVIKNNPGTIDPNFLIVFEQMLTKNNLMGATSAEGMANNQQTEVTGAAQPAPDEVASSGSSWLTTLLILVGILFALGAVAIAIFFYLRRRATEFSEDEDDYEDEEEQGYAEEDEYQPQAPSMAKSEAYSARSAAPIRQSTQNTITQNQQQPFARFQTTYMIGDDGYNESFSFDSRTGEFLGECGFGVSEFIGVGSPKKASAFEVWMFDKNDIQTITKVMMSPFAYKDQGSRAKLEAKGELIEIQPHKQVKLETASLFMIATISDVTFGQGMTPDPSHVEQITMDLAIWQK